MSIAERYSRATRSSDLELKVEPGDVDQLIAAGLVYEDFRDRQTLGTRLLRLRAEFDSISRSPQKRTLVPMLRGFVIARQFFVAYAVAEAPIRAKTIDDRQAAEIACRVLDLFLDPNCPACGGRGFNGGYGAPTLRCPACRETGKRQHLWKNDAQEAFAKWLASSAEAKADSALSQMRRKLSQR